MFKTVLVLALLFFASPAYADLSFVFPVSERVPHEAEIELGSVQPGETIEIALDTGTGYGPETKWRQLVVDPPFLPAGWVAADSGLSGRTLTATVTVPENAALNVYRFRLKAISPVQSVSNEVVDAIVFVEKRLLHASVANLKRTTRVGEPVSFHLALVNDSVAAHPVIVTATLSDEWFSPVTVDAEPLATTEASLTVSPPLAARQPFSFRVRSALTGEEIGSFNAVVEALPTPRGKLGAAEHGFPFFTPILSPYYLLFSALAQLF